MKKFYLMMFFIAMLGSINAQYIYNDYDANQNETFLGWPNMPVLVANPASGGVNTSPNVAQWDRSNWAQWDNVWTELSGKIDFTTGTVFSLKVYSPIACDVLFKLEDKTNGGIFVERLLSITTPNQWVQLDFDFTGEASDTYDKVVFFIDFATFNTNTFYFDDIEGPHYAGSQGKPLEAADVQDNFENNGWGTITNWIFQNPGMDPLQTTADPVNGANTVADYNRTGAFEYCNAQAELDHRMDLSARNVFEMDVYFPSSNDYTGPLSNNVDIKLQNSLLGGNAWMTQAVVSHVVDTYDQWVTLTFDFSGWSTTEDYDKIVVQFGGEGHWAPGQFYFDDIELLPNDPTPPYTYNDFDANQNHDFEGWPNMPTIVSNPDASGINTSANVAEWVRSADQWAHVYTVLDGRIDFTTGSNFQLKMYAPVNCNVLFKLEDKNNPGINIERSAMNNGTSEWVLLNFDFTGAASDTYDKIIIFFDFANPVDNTFYFDEVTGPEYDAPKPVLELDVQDNFENDGWGTITEWIFQDPGMDPLNTTADPVNGSNTVADYDRSGSFEWTNAQTILDHRMDLSERNIFKLDVYLPSSNDYTGPLTPTAAIKLQNSLMGGMAWSTQTEIKHTLTTFDAWVTLEFDFSAISDSINYDQIVVQLGGEGHWVAAQFYFDNLYLMHVPAITVEAPNGGETLEQGEAFVIEWNYLDWEGDLIIESIREGQNPQLIASSVDVMDTLYTWNVPPNQAAGSDYRIILTSMNNAFPSDTSDAFFTISEATGVQADFEADPTTFVVGDSTWFTDLSSDDATAWYWTFEGGTPDTYIGEQPPYIVYGSAGEFDVQLIVNNGVTIDTLVKVAYIVVGEMPVADFTASETVILAGQTVDFTNNSVGEGMSYAWYFEGGTPETSTNENPSGILYDEVGIFDVQLIVTNEFGADTMRKVDYIEAKPVGVLTIDQSNLKIYPNPVNDEITVEIQVASSIQIMDLTGRKMIEQQHQNNISVIDVSGLKSGIYLIRINSLQSQDVLVRKIIVQ